MQRSCRAWTPSGNAFSSLLPVNPTSGRRSRPPQACVCPGHSYSCACNWGQELQAEKLGTGGQGYLLVERSKAMLQSRLTDALLSVLVVWQPPAASSKQATACHDMSLDTWLREQHDCMWQEASLVLGDSMAAGAPQLRGTLFHTVSISSCLAHKIK